MNIPTFGKETRVTKSGARANAYGQYEAAAKGFVKAAEEEAAHLGAPFGGGKAEMLAKAELPGKKEEDKPGTVVVPAELPGPQAQAETSRQVDMVA